jgi:TatA/E family protein of Tat protein translocase
VTALAFLDVGFAEMVVCGFVALVLFGGRLPEVMRNLGATYRNFRRGMEDLKQQTGVDVRLPALGPSKPYAPMPRPTPDPALHPVEPTAAAPSASAPATKPASGAAVTGDDALLPPKAATPPRTDDEPPPV